MSWFKKKVLKLSNCALYCKDRESKKSQHWIPSILEIILPEFCIYRLLWGHFKKGMWVELSLLPRGLATKLDLRHPWKRSQTSQHLCHFTTQTKQCVESSWTRGGGGCSDTCMMRGTKTKGHEACLRLQLTVPLAGASPLSVFFSSTSFFSFSSYKIKACPLMNTTFGKEFILKCHTFSSRLVLIERKLINHICCKD